MQNKLWINGAWTEGTGNSRISVENPATGDKLTDIINATPEDVNAAVEAAKTAFYDGRWSGKTPGERSMILWKFADLLESRMEDFARVESENAGKPYKNLTLIGDIPFAIDNLRFFATAARDTHGSHAGEFMTGYTSFYRREPVGVVGQIAPWNYPFLMAIWKLGPSLAAGCTVVLKPASLTPLTTLMMAELSAEAGIPEGVLNIITGNVGQAMVAHPDIRMVSITGATSTGKRVMETAASNLKRVHLELGGKAPVLVFDDADVELVAQKIALAATCNTGQDCTAATRLYVQEGKLNAVREAFVEAIKKVKVGLPFDDDTEMGPLISADQREKVKGFVDRACSAGAKVLTGGKIPAAFSRGHYYEPTVIEGVDQKSEIVQNEVFGPVLTLQSFKDEAEAVMLGNDVKYGLASSVFTKDVGRAMRVSSRLEFGTVWVNDHLPLTSETPHGGFKQSGFGKDLSAEALHDYQITKHVMILR